jgi:hypothetical protein
LRFQRGLVLTSQPSFVITLLKLSIQNSAFRILLLALLLCSCSGVSQLDAQKPRSNVVGQTYRRVAVYFPPSSLPKKLSASYGGNLAADEAMKLTIVHALEAVAKDVQVDTAMLDFAAVKRQKLDAFFWVKYSSVFSSLSREGTLFPSYTADGGATVKIMRMGGFSGTIDSLLIQGRGSYYGHAIGTGRTAISRTGAEMALRDMATKLARALGGGSD